MTNPDLDKLLDGMTDENRHPEYFISLRMPMELTDEQADAALAATSSFLDIKGSALTVNREKMKARYRALVKFILKQQGKIND